MKPGSRPRIDTRWVVLAVCGLSVERRLADGPGVRAIAGGGRSIALAEAIEHAIARDAVVGIVSFGVAGALDPMLVPGSLIVADSVVADGRSRPVDVAWAQALRRRLPDAVGGAIVGSERIVADAMEKRRLRDATGARAVDMESQVAARIAGRHGLPFAVLRAIADPSGRSLPPAASIAMRADGSVDLAGVLRSLARRPAQLPQLLRIGLDTQKALRSLGRGRRLLGRGLGYLDLDQLPVDVV